MEHIGDHTRIAGLSLTERINLSGRIATEVVARRGGSLEDGLTVLETLGTVKGASLGAIMRLADATGRPYMDIHNLLAFCREMEVDVDFGRNWLEFFAVTLVDVDEVETAIYLANSIIDKIKTSETDRTARALNRGRDTASFLEEIRGLAERYGTFSLDELDDRVKT